MSEKKPGRLKSLAWYWQLLMFGAVAVLLFGAFWYFVTKPVRAETEELNNQIAQLRQKNEAARIASQRINEFRAAYASKMEEYEELKALLPEQREITNVLQNLQERARSSKLVLRRFTPKDDVQQDFVSGKPVEVEVTSTFANLREFYEQLARLQRIVSVTDFNITQSPQQTAYKTIDARFVLTAYYASPENLSAKPAAPPAGQKPAPGQPATPAPPGAPAPDKY
jgi:type IV pilus assembly protein PilO